jgi:TolB-like protein/DNA-binding winged helix-turn-helix (wHTH) protein
VVVDFFGIGGVPAFMGDAQPSRRAICFGVWELDVQAGELRNQDAKVKLQEQPFQILQVLLEHAGEVVTREELQRKVWPSDTFVDFDHGLYNAIKKLREALGDNADTPRFIETLPKRGYRFIATVNGNGVGVALRQRPLLGGPDTAPRQRHPKIVIGSVFAALSLLGLLLASNPGKLREKLLGRSVGPPIRSLAVLPLQNLSGDPSQEYFSDGMTEELITVLSRISGLRVISRTSVMRYKKTDKSLPDIARELNVDAIVEGSVLRSGDRVRITAQLIYGPKDTSLWAQTYDHDLRDVLALQGTVASAIAEEIRVKMTPTEKALVKGSRPVSLAAHEAYLQGQYHHQRAIDRFAKKDMEQTVEEEDKKAREYYRRAIKEDPNYAPAYVGISDASDDWPEKKAAIMKALELDESLAEAHYALARMRLERDWDWSGAEREFKRAIELSPNNADFHDGYANYLAAMERLDESMKEYLEAQALDPKGEHLADAYIQERQFDRAVELIRIYAETNPDFTLHYALAQIYGRLGRYDEAVREWQEMMTILGYGDISKAIGRGYAAGGYHGALRELARKAESLRRRKSFKTVASWVMAGFYAEMGDKDRAFAWLDKAYAEHDGSLTGLKSDVVWDPLRSDPRFAELVRRVGLPP